MTNIQSSSSAAPAQILAALMTKSIDHHDESDAKAGGGSGLISPRLLPLSPSNSRSSSSSMPAVQGTSKSRNLQKSAGGLIGGLVSLAKNNNMRLGKRARYDNSDTGDSKYYGGIMKSVSSSASSSSKSQSPSSANNNQVTWKTTEMTKTTTRTKALSTPPGTVDTVPASASPSLPLQFRDQRIRTTGQPMSPDSIADFDETEWTPQDSSYGAACPVCGCIPKRFRRMIEVTLIAIMLLGFVVLLVTTSMNIAEERRMSNSNNHNSSSTSSSNGQNIQVAASGSNNSNNNSTAVYAADGASTNDGYYVEYNNNYANNNKNSNSYNSNGNDDDNGYGGDDDVVITYNSNYASSNGGGRMLERIPEVTSIFFGEEDDDKFGIIDGRIQFLRRG